VVSASRFITYTAKGRSNETYTEAKKTKETHLEGFAQLIALSAQKILEALALRHIILQE
jgi:hypothetical protein